MKKTTRPILNPNISSLWIQRRREEWRRRREQPRRLKNRFQAGQEAQHLRTQIRKHPQPDRSGKRKIQRKEEIRRRPWRGVRFPVSGSKVKPCIGSGRSGWNRQRSSRWTNLKTNCNIMTRRKNLTNTQPSKIRTDQSLHSWTEHQLAL